MKPQRLRMLALALALGACAKNGSVVIVSVDSTMSLPDVGSLRVSAHASGRDLVKVVSLAVRSIPPVHTFGIELQPDQSGLVTVELEALSAAGSTVASASGSAGIEVGGTATLSITFGAGNSDAGVDLPAQTDGPVADLLPNLDMTRLPLVWTSQNVAAVGLYAIWGGDATHVWASGHSSANTFFSTGNDSWAQNGQNPFYNVNGLWGVDAIHGWMVDENGTIRVLNSTGTAWGTNVTLASLPVLTAVWGTSDTNVWVISSTINAGAAYHNVTGANILANWTTAHTDSGFGYNAVFGAAMDDLYIVGNAGNILRTNDGSTFTYHSFGSSALRGVYAADGTHVYVVGDGGAVGFSTGNSTFTQQTLPIAQAGYNYHAVWGTGPNDIYVVGDMGTILHSTGNGSWTVEPSGTTSTLLSIWGSGPGDVYASALNGDITHGK